VRDQLIRISSDRDVFGLAALRGCLSWFGLVVQDVHVTSDVGAIAVPPVRYARAAGGGCVAYRVYGKGGLDLLNVKEWAASVDACWEHPAHLRTQQYQGSLARCAMFDPRGIGPSDPVAVDDLGDIDAWVQDAIAVMDAIGMDRVVLFGEGFGGHAAVALAVAHPERVEALVLANCSVCGIQALRVEWRRARYPR
jgi:pimeloyl-ACP methyl ester carboxylesterase